MSDNQQDAQQLGGYGVTPEMIKSAFDTDFDKELNKTFSEEHGLTGGVVRGIVTGIENNEFVVIDIGMKAEGRVPLKEFSGLNDEPPTVAVGDEVDVFLENLDDRRGEAQLSREKAKREEVLDSLENAFNKGDKVDGIIFGKVKGGFMVDVMGILGFLPGSQLDARPVTDVNPYMHNTLDFQIVKLDRKRNNLIVSRRAMMDEAMEGNREELLADMQEGKKLKGVVKNITDYGAFVDLGGLDGLLHITDMAWHRINHPSEILKLGETIDVVVVRYDEKNQRVSLGLKQLHNDPWQKVDDTFPIGSKITGKITNITDYGAFVELAPGVEGLIHVSEMSWTRKNVHPGKIVSTSQEVEVLVLEIERDKRRISLGLKQCQDNPWQAYAKAKEVGDLVEGTIRSMTDFGIFLGLTEEIDGLIHISDLSWEKSSEEALQDYKKGDTVKAKILALDPEKERIALGVKQLAGDPFMDIAEKHKRGDKVMAKVTDTDNDGITVEFGGVEAYIKKRDLGVTREEQDPTRFSDGEEVEVKITTLGKKDRKLALSIRALQIDEEKEAVATYAEQEDQGDSALAEALKGAGIGAKEAKAEEEKPAKKTKAATAKKAKADKEEKPAKDAKAKAEPEAE